MGEYVVYCIITDESRSITHVYIKDGFQTVATVSQSQFIIVINYHTHFILQYKQMDFMGGWR